MSQSDSTDAVAFVGAAGGAGTTRTTVEVAAALAADGREVAILDAAFATQGLAQYVDGAIDPDVTSLLTDDNDTLASGLVELSFDREVSGRVAVCPSYAPFERLARAKSVEAAQRFESLVAEAAARFDHVLVDVPPIAANQAVAAVTAADRIAIVAPAAARGTEAVQQAHERLADVGSEADLVISTRGDLATADVSIPRMDQHAVADAPACLGGDDPVAGSVARVAAAVTEGEIDTSAEQSGRLSSVSGLLSR